MSWGSREANELVDLPDFNVNQATRRTVFGVPHDVLLGGLGTRTDIREPVLGAALHGHLIPGTVAFVAPFSHLGEVLDLSTTFHQWRRTQAAASNAQDTNRPIPPHSIILHPGDVHSFGEPLLDGISVYTNAPGTSYNSGGGINAGIDFEALIRVYKHTTPLPSRITYQSVPSHLSLGVVPPTGIPDATTTIGGVGAAQMVEGCTHISVNFRDDTGTPTPIVGAESGVYEIWWLNAAAIWLHHEDDDFDAGGRGVADVNHASETFEIGKGIIGFYIRRISGDAFFPDVVFIDQRQWP